MFYLQFVYIELVLNSIIFIKQDFSVSKSITELQASCPKGFKIPSSDDFNQLLLSIGSKNAYNLFIDSSNFQGKDKYYYMTTTKTNPLNLNGSENEAWEYEGLYIDWIKKNVVIKTVNTIFEKRIFDYFLLC